MRKVPPCDRTRKELHDLLAGGVEDESNPLSELLRLAVRLTLEEGLEAKARDVLGRDRYERQGDREGYRNGYRRDRVKSAEGVVDFAVPQLRDVS